ncbi:MAG TPA: HNH endonuclease [Planctomycetota bacterium]|nr:HNH endonuclease [Planctomycetota bacterium]
MLEERALVLNKSWTPISTTSVRRAIVLVVRGAAGIVDPETYSVQTWSDWLGTTPQDDGDDDADGDLLLQGFGFSVRVPQVIALRHYDGFPVRGVAFTRRNVYRRDGYACQYCGRRPGVEDLTIDHVIPRSRGGTTCWENCVTACRSCNAKKADYLAHELDLALERAPAAPRWPGGLDPASVRARPAWHRFLPQSTLLYGT